jgi:O-antigen ligase
MVPYLLRHAGRLFAGASYIFPSFISVGLLYGALALFLGVKHKYIHVPKWMVILTTMLAGSAIMMDAHRSVWSVIPPALLILLVAKEISPRAFIVSCIVTITLLFLLLFTSRTGHAWIEFLGTRAMGFMDPIGDLTAGWRIGIWQSSMEKIREAPLIGEGFGGYWNTLVPSEGLITTSPHSLYIQTLVKIGFLGMFLFLFVAYQLFVIMRNWIRTNRSEADPETAIVVSGLICLIGALAYGISYALEYYGWYFVGLAFAVIRNKALPGTAVAKKIAIYQ